MSSQIRLQSENRSAITSLALGEFKPTIEPKSSNLRLVGKYDKGYGIRFQSDVVDPFAEMAMVGIFGRVPPSVRGYTRSGGNLSNLVDSVMKYDREYKSLPRMWWMKQAINDAYAAFRLPRKIRPVDLPDVALQANTSAGWTWNGAKKSDVRAEAEVAASILSRVVCNGQVSWRSLPPCMAFKRTQLHKKGDPVKLRAVWGYDVTITLLEGKFATPLLEELKQNDTPMFVGRSQLKELPIFIDNACAKGTCYVTDITGFDSSLMPGLIKAAFGVVKQNFELSRDDHAVFDFLVRYFIKTPIVIPTGERVVKNGGIPSGSYFTSMIGSIINFIIQRAAQYALHGQAFPTKTLGDDSIQIVPEKVFIDREAWARFLLDQFGVVMSATKSSLSKIPWEVDFLGHSSRGGRVYRDRLKVLRLALYPEYPVKTMSESMARIMMMAADTGLYNQPLNEMLIWYRMQDAAVYREVDRFMRYVMSMDEPLREWLSDSQLLAIS